MAQQQQQRRGAVPAVQQAAPRRCGPMACQLQEATTAHRHSGSAADVLRGAQHLVHSRRLTWAPHLVHAGCLMAPCLSRSPDVQSSDAGGGPHGLEEAVVGDGGTREVQPLPGGIQQGGEERGGDDPLPASNGEHRGLRGREAERGRMGGREGGREKREGGWGEWHQGGQGTT